MGKFDGVVANLIKKMVSMHLDMNKAKILILGIGVNKYDDYYYDEEIIKLIKELQDYNIKTHLCDPYADKEFLKNNYGIQCENEMIGFGAITTYSAIILAVPHYEFTQSKFKLLEYVRGRIVIYDFHNFFPDELATLRL